MNRPFLKVHYTVIAGWRMEFPLRGTNEDNGCLKEGGKFRILFVAFCCFGLVFVFVVCYFLTMFVLVESNQCTQKVHESGLVQELNGKGLLIVELISTQLRRNCRKREGSSCSLDRAVQI